MSRRKVVHLNTDFVLGRIKEKCRSFAVFSERMGRGEYRAWPTLWRRGRNLPSPQEAARMCDLLGCTPEELLTVPEDIETVRALIVPHTISDEELQFALFGGDETITPEDLDDVRRYAAFIQARKKEREAQK